MEYKCSQALRHSVLLSNFDPLLEANRSVDDAVNMALHHILQHLDSLGTYARIATIIPALLQDKVSQQRVPDSTCRWITDFLTGSNT